MPIYEYHCRDCGNKFDELLSSVKDAVPCPHCHSEKTERVFSPFGIAGTVKFSASTGSNACTTCTSTNCSSCLSSSR